MCIRDSYTAAQASLDLHQKGMAGKQAGDPEKLAALIVQVADLDEPPLHLSVGQIATELAAQKLETCLLYTSRCV